MIAKDIMTTNVITVGEDLRILGVCKMLTEGRVSGAPVINKEGKLVGMVTERDLLLRNPLVTSVKDVMSKEVVTVTEDTPVEEISELLLTHSIKRVPVMRGEKITGMVSRLDILRGEVESGKPKGIAMPEMPFPSMLQAITLDYKTSKHLQSKIVDFRNDGILIYPPDRKGTIFDFPVGGKVTVRFCGDEGVCEFASTVLKKLKEPIPSYLLSFPHQVNLVQRREFYRLKVRDLKLNYCLVSREEAEGKVDPNRLPPKEYCQGKIYDISGRGVSFLIGEKKEKIKSKKFLHLQINLATDFIESYAQVIRQFSINDEVYAGTALIGLEEKTVDKIVAYILKTQREERRNLLRLRWTLWEMEES